MEAVHSFRTDSKGNRRSTLNLAKRESTSFAFLRHQRLFFPGCSCISSIDERRLAVPPELKRGCYRSSGRNGLRQLKSGVTQILPILRTKEAGALLAIRPPLLPFSWGSFLYLFSSRGQASQLRRHASISFICRSTSRRTANGLSAACSFLSRTFVASVTAVLASTRASGVCVTP